MVTKTRHRMGSTMAATCTVRLTIKEVMLKRLLASREGIIKHIIPIMVEVVQAEARCNMECPRFKRSPSLQVSRAHLAIHHQNRHMVHQLRIMATKASMPHMEMLECR